MTTTVAAPQATPASGDGGAPAETRRPSVSFLTPEVASYFIGVFKLFVGVRGNVGDPSFD